MNQLLAEMFDKTQQLVHIVEEADSDLDEWMVILDEREALIQNVQLLLTEGFTLSQQQKQQLEQMQKLNLQMMPLMEQRKENTQRKLEDIRKKKAARNFYNPEGAAGYGAFFDKRK